MKILAASDLHCDHDAARAIVDAAPAADLVLLAGDFANAHEGLAEIMAILAPLGEKAILVPGNNESLEALRAATDLTVLHGQEIERAGLIVVGLGGGIPPLPDADFASWDIEEAEAERLLAPYDTCDVLLTHSPPKGVGDRHSRAGSIGSEALREAAERMQPGLMAFGHVHDCWGAEGTIGTSLCRNLGPGLYWADL
ncbi:metallophosphoesterase family protein [Pseudoroseicyclus tamaricis]|uniref:Serine/threonine protein phosphatase n=1 Tax=Pseudoroseicyclus tamaricis TaxID=2705421 RepID=A0A6B2JVT8_9RHOB|nr:metallophosphoesterase [Pseudoroseicyclus tamaricis]NDU99511.1 serine/threonine protein phosphatase [Pseudoroseicyclus tamaricis]